MKTIISVTQADIDEGQRDECKKCPIALAANRCLRPGCYGWVTDFYLLLYANEADERYGRGPRLDLPQEAADFIYAFDNGHKFDAQPFTFELDIDPKYLPVT